LTATPFLTILKAYPPVVASANLARVRPKAVSVLIFKGNKKASPKARFSDQAILIHHSPLF
jgi:hypothetical protein